MAKEKGEIRLLRADEIECRIGTMNERGLSLLLFKDARVDQKVLDEIYPDGLEKESSADQWQFVLYSGSLGRIKRSVGRKTGCWNRELFRERKRSCLGQF